MWPEYGVTYVSARTTVTVPRTSKSQQWVMRRLALARYSCIDRIDLTSIRLNHAQCRRSEALAPSGRTSLPYLSVAAVEVASCTAGARRSDCDRNDRAGARSCRLSTQARQRNAGDAWDRDHAS